MNEAIRIAIEKGGFDARKYLPAIPHPDKRRMENLLRALEPQITRDPLFWQCLGKALGWRDYQYALHAHNYLGVILTGGDTEEFFKQLIRDA